jgi:Flp pilus assembly protein TadD
VRQEASQADGAWTRFEDASATPFAWYLGLAWFQQGQYGPAVDELERARTLSPWHPQVLNALGSAAGMGGDLKGAEEAYRAAIRLHPDWEEVTLNLAQVLRAQGKRDDAFELLEKGYQGPPSEQVQAYLDLLRDSVR